MADSSRKVGRYYDRNTKRFLALGHGGEAKAIRRAVWGPSVQSRSEAMEYVNALILRELETSGARRVIDLGCGVGGSIRYLGRRHPAEYLGVTISDTQATLGSEFLREAAIPDATIIRGDFTSPDLIEAHRTTADLVFAVESLIHVDRMPERLTAICDMVKPGGKLIVCDDVLAARDEGAPYHRRERRWLREFQAGWYADGLSRMEDIVAGAQSAGLRLVESRDLTPYLELDRTRDLAARAFMALVRWSPLRPPWFSNLLGGNALQLCLKHRIIRYIYSVFERRQ